MNGKLFKMCPNLSGNQACIKVYRQSLLLQKESSGLNSDLLPQSCLHELSAWAHLRRCFCNLRIDKYCIPILHCDVKKKKKKKRPMEPWLKFALLPYMQFPFCGQSSLFIVWLSWGKPASSRGDYLCKRTWAREMAEREGDVADNLQGLLP